MKKVLESIDQKTKTLFLGGLAICLFATWILYDKGLIGSNASSPISKSDEKSASVIFPDSQTETNLEKTEIYHEDMKEEHVQELSSEDFFGQQKSPEPSEDEQRQQEAREKYGDLFNETREGSKPKKKNQPITQKKHVEQTEEPAETPPKKFSFYSIQKGTTQSAQPVQHEQQGTSCVVHNEQTIRNGQTLRIRLEEDMTTESGVVLSRATLLYGAVSFGKDRISISIRNASIGNQLITVNRDVYSIDGLKGLPYAEIPGAEDTRNQLIDNTVSDMSRTSRTPSLLEGLGNTARRTAKEPKITLPNEMKLILK